MLLTKNLKLKRLSKKLIARFIGPFSIAEPVRKQAYRLYLPTSYRIHLVFYISLLEPYKQRKGAARDPLPGPIKLDDEEDQEDRYEVEEIRGRKGRNQTLQYLVKWKG